MLERYKNWKYKNTSLLVLSLAALFCFADVPQVKDSISSIGSLGYAGAFLAGIFFVSIFTVAPASVVLFFLAKDYDPAIIALCAGLGAVVGDYFIFRFLKDGVFAELRGVFGRLGGSYVSKLFRTPYFSWILPILGAAIIASPFPDELGISMLGLSKVKNWQFVLISFALNAIGIFLIIMASQSFA